VIHIQPSILSRSGHATRAIWPVLLLSFFALAPCASASTQILWRAPTQIGWSYTNPTPPPPASAAHWWRFVELYTGFKLVHRGTDPERFARWALQHGVRDPLELSILVSLYLWAEKPDGR
jgi:hypothetical protein